MRSENFDVHKLVEELQGTCHSISDFLPDEMNEMDLTTEDHEHIDNEIFLCETCGWWYEVCESGDCEGNCENCIDEEEE